MKYIYFILIVDVWFAAFATCKWLSVEHPLILPNAGGEKEVVEYGPNTPNVGATVKVPYWSQLRRRFDKKISVAQFSTYKTASQHSQPAQFCCTHFSERKIFDAKHESPIRVGLKKCCDQCITTNAAMFYGFSMFNSAKLRVNIQTKHRSLKEGSEMIQGAAFIISQCKGCNKWFDLKDSYPNFYALNRPLIFNRLCEEREAATIFKNMNKQKKLQPDDKAMAAAMTTVAKKIEAKVKEPLQDRINRKVFRLYDSYVRDQVGLGAYSYEFSSSECKSDEPFLDEYLEQVSHKAFGLLA